MRRALALLLLAAPVPAAAQDVVPIPPVRPGTLSQAEPDAPAGPAVLPGTAAMPGSAVTRTGGTLRVLDKINGSVTDLDLASGQTVAIGLLTVTMGECRVPADNPAGDAFALVSIRTAEDETALFEGWLIASAPALNAIDHPRYDVWALRCAGG